ncbi:MAG: orotidine-5'-phosphate decarboxylase, partial [Gammaproteobacteria bacterium]
MSAQSAAANPRVVVALDHADAGAALAMAARLDPALCRLKVGKELFTAAGPELVCELGRRGHEVFLDLKFHDIPNTVASALRAAAGLGVWMVNVHAAGGRRMLLAARDALGPPGPGVPLLIAVTVLTSMDAADLAETGVAGSLESQVLRLARLARDCGLDGVVCSAREAPELRRELGAAPVLVTPGIRPAGSLPDDQRRTLTPREAIAAGSSYLVLGRPVTGAPDPDATLRTI